MYGPICSVSQDVAQQIESARQQTYAESGRCGYFVGGGRAIPTKDMIMDILLLQWWIGCMRKHGSQNVEENTSMGIGGRTMSVDETEGAA